MKWLKPNTFYYEFDVSASTILKLIKEGILKEGKRIRKIELLREYQSLSWLIDGI